ncbi:MAG: hypothetical protein Q4C44_01225 [bacterium]|nr:hypothetical protein [bacterium]
MDKINSDKVSLIVWGIVLLCAIVFAVISNKESFDSSNYDGNSYSFLHDYEVNEVVYMSVDDEAMARKYLGEFVNLVIFDREAAYALIDDEYKEAKLPTIEDFNKKIDSINSTNFRKAKVTSYTVKKASNYKLFYVIDGSDNIFVFKENSIMNYSVYLDSFTVKK